MGDFDTGRTLLLVALTLLRVTPTTAGESFVPADDAEVLEVLPTEVFARRDRVARLRQRLAEQPDDVGLAAEIAQHYVGLGKTHGDPRYFGYARAAIRRWWDNPGDQAEILRVRAELHEADHNYDSAIRDLRELLAIDPKDSQAKVEIANIARVIGDYSTAQQAAEELGDPAKSVPAMVAMAPLLAVTGEAEAAYELIADSLPTLREQHESVVPWALTMLGEIARALGRTEVAERHFREGIAVTPEGSYLRRAFADFLLDTGRAEDAYQLLDDNETDNGLLLRSAIAAKQSGHVAEATERAARLRDRFTETRLRGDLPHGRYEARFELEFGADPSLALEIAVQNWGRQKELRDTRNLLAAAVADGDQEAAAPALEFLHRHGIQDVALSRLVAELEAE